MASKTTSVSNTVAPQSSFQDMTSEKQAKGIAGLVFSRWFNNTDLYLGRGQ